MIMTRYQKVTSAAGKDYYYKTVDGIRTAVSEDEYIHYWEENTTAINSKGEITKRFLTYLKCFSPEDAASLKALAETLQEDGLRDVTIARIIEMDQLLPEEEE